MMRGLLVSSIALFCVLIDPTFSVFEIKSDSVHDDDDAKSVREYWGNFTSHPNRGIISVTPPLSSIVHRACSSNLLTQHIIWIGGPPGSGETTLVKRFQNYGFMSLDAEDPWSKGNIVKLKDVTEKVYKNLTASFVFGACFGQWLVHAPEYVYPILLLPSQDVYERRWKKRDISDSQNHHHHWEVCNSLVGTKNIRTLFQDSDENIDTTIMRICQLVHGTRTKRSGGNMAADNKNIH
jgi:hypothetical protein